MSSTPTARLAVLVIAVALTITACGSAAQSPASDAAAGDTTTEAAGDAGPPSATPEASEVAYPVTVTAANGEVTISERPESIVTLSPTATEMLFAIDAGDQVAAADDFSNYPSEAPTTDLSGFEPNVEAIAGYEPDLVVIADDSGDLSAALAELDIPVMVHPAASTLDDAYQQIEQLGTATGHAAQAAALVEQLRSEIDKIVADVPTPDEPLTYYHELDDTYYSVTSDTFIGQIYELFGLRNIADGAGAGGGGYPQLSEEFIIDADPDLIFLADTKCCGQSAETVAERPGWEQISAVRNDAVIELDDDIASRWGPRIVDLVRTIGDAVTAHVEASGS
ncbi:MAG: ABC transporter substrate-binding protein [Actinobacteria bacterium]|nr:ABC transporter substrate-binding protein [Actinomycetota bacterium]